VAGLACRLDQDGPAVVECSLRRSPASAANARLRELLAERDVLIADPR